MSRLPCKTSWFVRLNLKAAQRDSRHCLVRHILYLQFFTHFSRHCLSFSVCKLAGSG